jgi:electron transport complex protein RnfC
VRKVWDIHGGVHPPQNKYQSVRNPIVKIPLPAQLTFPLSQHIGAPAVPIVAIGDKVLKGQMIAEAKGFVSVPIHASSSGEVIDIGLHNIAHSSGMAAPCIVIATDGRDEWVPKRKIIEYNQTEKSELLEIIHDAGIAGMGGAGFPSAVKLTTQPHHTIETLIINGTECEPYITADDILMRERAEEIVRGAEILSYISEPLETLIGVEDNKPEGIAALRKAAEGTAIEIVSFPTKYPSGGEKQLIEILTGKEVPSGKLPADVGIVCQNVGTTVAVYRAICYGEPLISRITTVTGEAVDDPQNYEVLLGTPVSDVLTLSGYHPDKNNRLLMGGPMMGFALESAEVPMVKTTNCILAPTEPELPTPPPPQACIRCGMCAEACPASLLPQQLYWFAQGKEYEKLEAHNIMDCIECGACSYACPSNIPLVQYYRSSKSDIRQLHADHMNSERARERFEARQTRLEKEEIAKLEKRKQRKAAAEARAAADGGDDKQDAIQAAIERAKAKRATQSNIASSIENSNKKLEDAVAIAEKRLKQAEQKQRDAKQQNSEHLAAFETAVEKSTEKLQTAKIALTEYKASSSSETVPKPSSCSDPAQAAIDKAAAARATGRDLSPQEKVELKLEDLQKRLQSIEKKLAVTNDGEQGEKIKIALTASIVLLKEKIIVTKTELSTTRKNSEGAVPAQAGGDNAQAAIDKLMAKRPVPAAIPTLSTPGQLKKNRISISKRLAKTRVKLAAAKEKKSGTVELLETSIKKLELKLGKINSELHTLTQQHQSKSSSQEQGD